MGLGGYISLVGFRWMGEGSCLEGKGEQCVERV